MVCFTVSNIGCISWSSEYLGHGNFTLSCLLCRAHAKHPSSAHKKHHTDSRQPAIEVVQLPITPLAKGSSGKGKSSLAPSYPPGRQSPRRAKKDVWDEDQSLLHMLSQASPHRCHMQCCFQPLPAHPLRVEFHDEQCLHVCQYATHAWVHLWCSGDVHFDTCHPTLSAGLLLNQGSQVKLQATVLISIQQLCIMYLSFTML